MDLIFGNSSADAPVFIPDDGVFAIQTLAEIFLFACLGGRCGRTCIPGFYFDGNCQAAGKAGSKAGGIRDFILNIVKAFYLAGPVQYVEKYPVHPRGIFFTLQSMTKSLAWGDGLLHLQKAWQKS